MKPSLAGMSHPKSGKGSFHMAPPVSGYMMVGSEHRLQGIFNGGRGWYDDEMSLGIGPLGVHTTWPAICRVAVVVVACLRLDTRQSHVVTAYLWRRYKVLANESKWFYKLYE
jgi:hypothetical protein